MKYDDLTPEEQALIQQKRDRDAARAKAQRLQVHLLYTAAAYLEWLNDTGNGSTFTTFCDDFGYEVPAELSVEITEVGHVFRWVADLISTKHILQYIDGFIPAEIQDERLDIGMDNNLNRALAWIRSQALQSISVGDLQRSKRIKIGDCYGKANECRAILSRLVELGYLECEGNLFKVTCD